MKENESRERCFQNALAMLTIFNQWLPKRHSGLRMYECSIELSLYFHKDERELLDTVVAMLEPLKLEWADYSENYIVECESYIARYTWEIVD